MSFADKKVALLYFTNFRKVILQRRETLPLEEMAQTINDLAEANDGWVKVTEDELRAIEEDPKHGLSLAALMYVRFMGYKVDVLGSIDKHKLKEDDVEVLKKAYSWQNKRGNRYSRNYELLEMVRKMKHKVTSIYVNYQQGEQKRQVFIDIGNEDQKLQEVLLLLRSHLLDKMAAVGISAKAHAKRVSVIKKGRKKVRSLK